jgi:DNA-binding PadR family transcriptional regulator
MAPRKLTTASYLVLGMIDMLGPVTPYGLKTAAANTVTHFWSLPHTQIYTQCDRLLADGYVSERREREGRRRRRFSITKKGEQSLRRWLTEGADVVADMRDLATLKMFFGADPQKLAQAQTKLHQDTLAYYLSLRGADGVDGGPLLALEVGIAHERAMVRFWKGQSGEA